MRSFNKIFGVGLSRTGTTSLNEALIMLGIPAMHFPQSFEDIENHRASTDSPIALQFAALDEYFPGSLFVLTRRDMGEWLHSVEKYWASFDHFAFSPNIVDLHKKLYGSANFDRDLYAQAYAHHCDRVVKHFASRPDDLLQIEICAGAGWGPLCEFLQTSVRSDPFPRMFLSGRDPVQQAAT